MAHRPQLEQVCICMPHTCLFTPIGDAVSQTLQDRWKSAMLQRKGVAMIMTDMPGDDTCRAVVGADSIRAPLTPLQRFEADRQQPGWSYARRIMTLSFVLLVNSMVDDRQSGLNGLTVVQPNEIG